jgi:hypothetical protein
LSNFLRTGDDFDASSTVCRSQAAEAPAQHFPHRADRRYEAQAGSATDAEKELTLGVGSTRAEKPDTGGGASVAGNIGAGVVSSLGGSPCFSTNTWIAMIGKQSQTMKHEKKSPDISKTLTVSCPIFGRASLSERLGHIGAGFHWWSRDDNKNCDCD